MINLVGGTKATVDFNSLRPDGTLPVLRSQLIAIKAPEVGDTIEVRDTDGNSCSAQVTEVRERVLLAVVVPNSWRVPLSFPFEAPRVDPKVIAVTTGTVGGTPTLSLTPGSKALRTRTA